MSECPPLSDERIRAVLRSRGGLLTGAPKGDVFSPWINAWLGRWGDGSVWDRTRYHEALHPFVGVA